MLALFMLGVFWQRATATGAFAALVAGHATAAVFLALSVTGVLTCQFLYLPSILLAVSMAMMVGVSLQTPAPAPEKVDGLTWTPACWCAESAELKHVPAWKTYRVQATALLVLTAIVIGLFW